MTTALQAPNAAETPRQATFQVAIDRTLFAEELAARAADGGTDDSIPVVFSSEYPVVRYDWWNDERYLEVLVHSRDAIDLGRAARGLPFLDSHDMREQIGRVESIELRSDGKLAGRVRFSRRQVAQDFRQDIVDGIRGELSVGYRIDPDRVDVVTRDGELPRYMVQRWEPFEVSGVSIPADPTVGANRSASPPTHALPRPRSAVAGAGRSESTDAARAGVVTNNAPRAEDTMEDDSNVPDSGGTKVTVTRNEAPDADARRRTLAELAEKHGVQDVLARGLAQGHDLDAISGAMMHELTERTKKGPEFGSRVTLNEREQREFSFRRAILNANDGENCFEREVSDTISKNLPMGYKTKNNGIFVPTDVGMPQLPGQRTALVAATSALGGAYVFTVPGSFIDLLRNKTFVLQAGATMFPGLSAPVSFPKLTSGGTAYWVSENDSAVTESNIGTGLISLTPKTLMATQAFSKQLLLEARNVVNTEMLVRNDLARVHAIAIDRAAIAGLGASNEPLGITKSTAVGTVTMGAAGAVPTYDALIDLEVLVRVGNVDGQLSYLTTPQIAGKLKKTQKFATTNGEAVWSGDLINGFANGARAFATNQVPSNLTKGTSTTVCHAIIAGAFENLYWGEFGAMEIITDPYAQKKKGLIEVTSFQMVDLAIRYDAAFATILDAKTS